nr:immunoglobulin light chain junction region [Macaca mulatta]MOW08553.1 immunoglobulin light chain junction region [Macaca mulatta]MOW08632.1 immunoglobulin light chain junction region [Macaca mulatta]MOW08648.1 immunoglobulin light chain junction region [Macaca mulatta]MOW08731.1 immunoglobulin light chain junction region [Macaca mulatta]
CQIYITSPLTF